MTDGTVIHRNKQAPGVKAWTTQLRLSPDMKPALFEAAHGSGNLSLGLYIDTLLKQLADEDGNLPLLTEELIAEVRQKSAA
jgi:hypothetical protein